MQSVPEADRNTGQAMAISRISRNLDRYRETQALVPAPATDPAPPVPETASTPDTPVASESTESVMIADASLPSSPAPTQEPMTSADTTTADSTNA